jgi:cytochrome c
VNGRAAALVVALPLVLAPFAMARADAARGARVFQRCYACHSVEAGEEKLPGPNLRCLLGRRAGSRPGFEFSPAMVEAGTARDLVWTRAALERFLADPEAVVPSTTMSMPGLPNPDDRRDVVDYLEQAGACPG